MRHGGHPVTTGHATIDGFLSCAATEPEGADLHYTENFPPARHRHALPAADAAGADRARGLQPAAGRRYCFVPNRCSRFIRQRCAVRPRSGRESAGDAGAVRGPPSRRHRPIHAPARAVSSSTACPSASAHAYRRSFRTTIIWRSISPATRCSTPCAWSGGQTSVDALDCGFAGGDAARIDDARPPERGHAVLCWDCTS